MLLCESLVVGYQTLKQNSWSSYCLLGSCYAPEQSFTACLLRYALRCLCVTRSMMVPWRVAPQRLNYTCLNCS